MIAAYHGPRSQARRASAETETMAAYHDPRSQARRASAETETMAAYHDPRSQRHQFGCLKKKMEKMDLGTQTADHHGPS
jgi:hypothetical protein